MFATVLFKTVITVAFNLGTDFLRVPTFIDIRRNFKRRMLPTQVLASQCNFIVTQRCAVAFFLTLLIRGTKADDGLAADDGRTIRNGTRFINRLLDGFRIVTVNLRNDVPAVGFKALRRIVRKPDVYIDADSETMEMPLSS